MTGDVSRARLAKAVAIVTAIVLAVPIAGMVLEDDGSEARADAGTVFANPLRMSMGGDPFAVLEEVDGSFQGMPAQFPAYFDDEIGLPEGCRDARSDGSTVVGCVVDGNSAVVMAEVTAQLEGKGWTPVPLGQVEGATFVKEGGSCRWVLVTCTQVGNATSVVYRCMTA